MTKKKHFFIGKLLFSISILLFSATGHTQANRCYAKAMPTAGEGGQAWSIDKKTAEQQALTSCRINASKTGGKPNTCEIVESKCS